MKTMTGGARTVLLMVLLLAPGCATARGAAENHAGERPVAVLGALTEEVRRLESRLVDAEPRVIRGIPFTTGTLAGERVVLARVGVGKVNAAVVTTLLLEHFAPRAVVFTGVAGALDDALGIGDLVLGTESAQHDFGVVDETGMWNRGTLSPADTARNPVRFAADTMLLRLASAAAERVEWRSHVGQETRPPRVARGLVLTGDVFMASEAGRAELRRRFPDALAVEMEGAAIAQVLWQQGRVPLLVVRSISDGAGDEARTTFAEFVPVAADNSARLVEAVVERLGEERRGAGAGR